MKFGLLAVDDAAGALLAHATTVGRRRLKKGHKLAAADLGDLKAHGIETIIAAHLDENDVVENDAARILADRVCGPGVRNDRPFTGRVNLYAAEAGVLRLDLERLSALNRVHEDITIATLADYSAVGEGTMVATVKIIPFAVEKAALATALDVLDGPSPSLAIEAFHGISAFLIQTTLPSLKASVLDKTVSITRERIQQVGGRLLGEQRVAHEAEALAAVIEEAPAVNVLLIAGASAITDRRDVLPSAVEAAGGRVLHFGMPVDPGNLLLLAEIEGRLVLGLPGCARSPKLNGFDWVLQRAGAGIAVTADDIMGMGVGGLLAEITTRPQPRDAALDPRGRKVGVIVLAAGQSRRMGPTNKLLEDYGGQALVTYPIDAALASRAVEVVVVSGHEPERLKEAIGSRPVRMVQNPDFADGLSTSLRCGLDALTGDIDAVVICLGDMPRLSASHLDRLIEAFDPEQHISVCVPTVNGKRGNPVLFGRAHFQAMREATGDVGARHLIGDLSTVLVEVPMDDDATLLDIDTPAALAELRGDS